MFYRTLALWGRCPALTPLLHLITPSRASGTADHVQSFDDWLHSYDFGTDQRVGSLLWWLSCRQYRWEFLFCRAPCRRWQSCDSQDQKRALGFPEYLPIRGRPEGPPAECIQFENIFHLCFHVCKFAAYFSWVE